MTLLTFVSKVSNKRALEKGFDGALQALKQAVEVFHRVEGWSPLEIVLELLKQTVETLEEPEGEWGIADLFREMEDLAAAN